MTAPSLTEFLLARIAEDEAAARSAAYMWRNEWSSEDVGVTTHIERHDPARVLAECEAKRRVVELHRSTLGSEVHKNGRWDSDAGVMVACCYWWCGVCDADRDYGFTGGPDEGCETLRTLALPYADHPDYRQEWKP